MNRSCAIFSLHDNEPPSCSLWRGPDFLFLAELLLRAVSVLWLTWVVA